MAGFKTPQKNIEMLTEYQLLQHNRSQLGYTNKFYHIPRLDRFQVHFKWTEVAPAMLQITLECFPLLSPPFTAYLPLTKTQWGPDCYPVKL